jgi:glucose/mannose transport system substrate-binding protein
MRKDNTRLSRRKFVYTGTTVAALGLAGCSGDGGGDGTATDTAEPTDMPAVEIMHGWTGGDGKTAADNLRDTFQNNYDVELDWNPIGGGGNQNLDAVVANRLQNNNPPGAFANWPGPNLVKYEGVLGNVSDIWDEEGFEDAHVEEAHDLHKQDGEYRAVPLGSHRLNNLFYNQAVVDEAGVTPEDITDVSSLVDALETVANETDKIPMTHGMQGTWTTTQLWASTMLGQEGFDAYMSFLDGNPDRAAVRRTFESLETILSNYISDDSATIGLTGSNNNIINGNAAFIHQGNWAAGAFRNSEGFAYNDDWGAKAYPGTEDMYMLHFDSFLYPSDNPAPEATKTWMAYVGSKDAQIAFNKFKGSIPTRTDIDLAGNDFGPYLQDAADDFANAEERPPNLQHGLGVVAKTMTSLNDVISSNFSGPFNVEDATDGFVDAVSN